MNLHEFENCPVTFTIRAIDGKWKLLILYLITNDIRRFGKLSMMLKTISRQMLTSQLRELEKDGIIERVIYAEIPPRVEYFLTEKGKELAPVIEALKDWGLQYNQPQMQEQRPQLA
jgi:DNA-binding HxlR family transcriptional regulator